MPGRIENPVQLLGSAQSAFLLTKHFRGTEAVVIAFAMRPMRLSIIIGHKALMSQLRSLPACHLLEMHLTHAPHHVNYVELPLVALKKSRGIERQIHIMQVM